MRKLSKYSPTRKLLIEATHTSINKMLNFIKEEYNLPELKLEIRLNFDPDKNQSWAGRYAVNDCWIEIAVAKYREPIELPRTMDRVEYEIIEDSPIIGTLRSVHWTKALDATVAHEMAHVLQHAIPKTSKIPTRFGFPDFDGSRQYYGHSKFWQEIYAVLRERFVNKQKNP